MGHSKVNLAMDVYDRSDAEDIATALLPNRDLVTLGNNTSSKPTTPVFILKGLVSAEGIESARQHKLNNMQGHGWHRSTWKAVVGRLTDCKTDCTVRPASGPRLASDGRRRYFPPNPRWRHWSGRAGFEPPRYCAFIGYAGVYNAGNTCCGIIGLQLFFGPP